MEKFAVFATLMVGEDNEVLFLNLNYRQNQLTGN